MVHDGALARALVVLALFTLGALATLGCSAESAPQSTNATDAGVGCDAGEYTDDAGQCATPGLPIDMACPPGQWQSDASACIPAGVPPGGCGAGFTHDGDGGCNPILPADACPKGMMAVPGDTTCHEVSPCGNGTWGNIPVDASTQYVNAAYPNMDSDGSAAKPWTTILAATSAANPGGIVAIAAGAYAEDVSVTAKPVRLWGRCPSMVTISGGGVTKTVIVIAGKGAAATELHAVAITGLVGGILVKGSPDVVIDGVWVHDTLNTGLAVQDNAGVASAAVSHTLIEGVANLGVFGYGATIALDSVVVRGTLLSDGSDGDGIFVEDDDTTKRRGTLTLTTALVEQNQEAGVTLFGSDGVLENTVVRGTTASPTNLGYGVNAVDDPMTKQRGSVHLLTSLVEGNQAAGVEIQGSDATIEATVVRGTLPDAEQNFGDGIDALDDKNGFRSTLTLRTSLVDDNKEVGLLILASDAVVDSTLVRGTSTNIPGSGWGVGVESDPMVKMRGTLELTTSTVESNQGFGVFAMGSDVMIEASLVSQTRASDLGDGRGIQIELQCLEKTCDPAVRSTATIHATLVEGNLEAGIAIDTSDATIDECVVRATSASATAGLGDGVVVYSDEGPASAVITRTSVEQSARAGISNFGADVTLGSSVLECSDFDLDGEAQMGVAYAFHDLGKNECGCPNATSACKATSSMLTPPPSVAGLE